MNLTTLKVKRLSLAQESRIIRRLKKSLVRQARDRKAKGKDAGWRTETIQSLHRHRVHSVRRASRVSHLAHNFIKGTPYHKAENFTHDAQYPVVMLKLSMAIANEIGNFGWPEMKNMAKEDRERAVASWMNI